MQLDKFLPFFALQDPHRARYEGVFDNNQVVFFYFSLNLHVVTPPLNPLIEMVQMRDHNICFYAELTIIILIIVKYSFLSKDPSTEQAY